VCLTPKHISFFTFFISFFFLAKMSMSILLVAVLLMFVVLFIVSRNAKEARDEVVEDDVEVKPTVSYNLDSWLSVSVRMAAVGSSPFFSVVSPFPSLLTCNCNCLSVSVSVSLSLCLSVCLSCLSLSLPPPPSLSPSPPPFAPLPFHLTTASLHFD
jgi:hypothetical protein